MHTLDAVMVMHTQVFMHILDGAIFMHTLDAAIVMHTLVFMHILDGVIFMHIYVHYRL